MTSSFVWSRGRQFRTVLTALAVPLGMLIVWITYSVGDTLARPLEHVTTVVENKQHFETNPTYVGKVVAGRTWIQEAEGSDYWSIECSLDDQKIWGLITKAQFDQVNVGDKVSVKFCRGRFTKQIFIVDIVSDASKGEVNHVIPSN